MKTKALKSMLSFSAAVLLAAASIAQAALPESGSFSGAETLTQSHNHAGAYDGNVRMAGVLGAPPAVLGVNFSRHRPLPPAETAPAAEKGLHVASVADPLADRALTAEELEKLVEMFPRQREEVGDGFVAQAVGAVKNAVLDTQDRAFTEAMLTKLQESEVGRRVLRELSFEAGRKGLRITIQPKEYEGTSIVKSSYKAPNGDTATMESLWGIRGMATYGSWQYNYNEGFMRMEDREKALEIASSNMGHELNHLVWKLKSDRLIPEYREVLQRDLGNEQSARLVGYLVSTQINDGRPSDYTEETKGLVANPQAYWDGMKMWHPGYAMSLDAAERKDPIAAYTKRLADLTRKREKIIQQRDLWQPAQEKALAHFEGPEHNMKEALSDIRSYLDGSKGRYAVNLKQADDSIRYVGDLKEYFEAGKDDPKKNPKAAGLLNATIRSATDPDYLKFEAQMRQDQKDLVDLVKKQGLPELETEGTGKISWGQFYALVEKDRAENPEHWSGGDAK